MKCTNHPERNAINQCSVCGAYLCDICVGSRGAGIIKCDQCMMFSALSEMTQKAKETKQKRYERKIDDTIGKQKGRKTIFLITGAIVFLIAIIEVIWYFNISPAEIEGFAPSEDIFVTTTVINEAIDNYSEDHNGIVPDSLEDLVGDYLPRGQKWENSLRDFRYRKITNYKYELVPPVTDSNTLPNFIFTEEGINLIGT